MKFSIVIPCLNSEKYVGTALQSLVSQSYQSFEIIVVDGGSTDRTCAIVQEFSDHISHYISEPDQGQSDAFNKGFRLAQGDYLLWLNGDDLLMPNTLLLAAQLLERRKECRWLTFNTIFVDADERIQFFYKGPKWNSFLVRGRGPQVDCPTSIFHRSLFLESEGFDLRLNYAMDIDLWFQFLRQGQQWHRLNHYGYAFRMHEGSKTGSEGYGAHSSPEKLSQGQLISEKYSFTPSRSAVAISKLFKALNSKPIAAFATRRWKGKQLSAYCSH